MALKGAVKSRAKKRVTDQKNAVTRRIIRSTDPKFSAAHLQKAASAIDATRELTLASKLANDKARELGWIV